MLIDVDFADDIEVSTPYIESIIDGTDGLGGPPVTDPGTLDVIIYSPSFVAELIHRTTIDSVIDAIIDSHKIPTTNKIADADDVRACLEVAQSLRNAAAKLEAACESPV